MEKRRVAMDNQQQARLTAGEISQLWAQYMNDSGSVCMLAYFLENAEDEEIRNIIEMALKISAGHISKLTNKFKEEKHCIPHGFKIGEDVDIQAPKLYSDTFVLNFIHQMARIGLTTYSASVASSVRPDITDYYMECLTETMNLYKVSKELLLTKGLYMRPPHIPAVEKVEYVKEQGFVLDVFGAKRPLAASEIANLHSNLQRNALGAATLSGFSQVAKSREVNEFFIKGINIAKKHIKLFGLKLDESDLPVAMTWGSEVTDSTSQTFSDKLMMFFTTGMISLSIGFYGTAIAQSPRADIGIMYSRLSMEVQLYSEDGANIMINNGWMEQPPLAADRGNLARKGK
jgi:hypothetical protein